MQVRRKTLEYDGAVYVIAPLTLDQTEEFLKPLDLPKDISDPERLRAYDDASLKVISMSLNNAATAAAPNGGGTGQQEWTIESCRKELDRWLTGKLYSEILTFSGLRLEEKTPLGERPAALENSSAKSEAA